MHTSVGSGSCAQFEINACVKELHRHGIPAEEIDKFIPVVKWPQAKRDCLVKNFFERRTSLKADTHLRAFAGETMDALGVLEVFCDL